MSHMCGRASSDRKKVFSVFCKQLKTIGKSAFPVSTASIDCKCVNHYCKTHCRHKMKRLKTRKERSQMRGSGKEASKAKSHHHHCHRQISKDISFFHTHCHNSCPSRIDAPIPNVVPATQEPSIITDSRLIGHQGLFNHEVKSIDIERLLSEQRKLEKNGAQTQEKNNATSHPSSTCHIFSPLSSNGLLDSDNDEVGSSQKKAKTTTKALDNCQEKEKKTLRSYSQTSDVTPGHRPAQIFDLLSESDKNIESSKLSSFDEVIIKSKKTKLSEKDRKSPQTPTGYKENVMKLKKKVKGQRMSTLEHTPNNQELPVYQRQLSYPSPSSLLHSSSPTAAASDSRDIHHPKQDPDSVSKSVSAVAASLCRSVWFPHLRKRSLMAESREVLLKALRERHGPQLQRNLLEVQRCLDFDTDPLPREVLDQDQEPIITDEDGSWCTDAFTTAFQAESTSQSCFGAEKTAAFKMTESQQFNRESSQWPNQYHEETTEWLTSPVERSVSLLDDIFSRSCSPHFCMDFEPSQGLSGESEHLFAPSHTSHCEDKARVSQHLEDGFIRPKKELVRFDSFENSFTNLPDNRTVTERSSRLHNSDRMQPFIPYQVYLPDRHSELVPFPQEQGSFETTHRCSFAPSSSAHIYHPQQSSHFQPFSQFSPSSACPPLRYHHTDMTHFPPSHMLDRCPVSTISSFPSPEHWFFPPMRLY